MKNIFTVYLKDIVNLNIFKCSWLFLLAACNIAAIIGVAWL